MQPKSQAFSMTSAAARAADFHLSILPDLLNRGLAEYSKALLVSKPFAAPLVARPVSAFYQFFAYMIGKMRSESRHNSVYDKLNNLIE
ncbi:MAG: hypothetical protein ACLR6J_11535 [Parabacteroides merdae]